MISSLYFWKNWNTAYRWVLGTGLFLLLATVGAFVWTGLRGLENVVRWDTLSELTELTTPIASFTDGLFDYPVMGKAYVVAEQFVASTMFVDDLAVRLVTLGICVSFAFLLGAITRLERWPYLIAMGILIVLAASFRLEALQLPGVIGNAFDGRLPFLGLVVLLGGASYYFHAFRTEAPLPLRLGVFLLLILGVWLAVNRLSGHPHPAQTFMAYALPGLLVVSLGFIFLISAEIIAALVYLTSAPRSGRKPLGLGNFLFISGLYLVNLLLVWLSNTKAINWNPVIVSPFVLYLISLGLGFWGFRQQLRQTESGVSYRDSGAFLYLGLGMLTTLTITYAFVAANDPLVEALEDAILYTHLGVGLFFTGYVVANFFPLFRQALPVYKVLYKPLRFSLFQTRVLAAIGIAVLLSTESFFPLNQAAAGYFNNLGDLYGATGEVRVAEQYYGLALKSEFQNHKSNYALASLALSQGDKGTAAVYFQRALLKQPSPQAYAGLSGVLLQDNLFFEAVKTLQQGIRAFPQNGELQNNLGYLYARTSVADSAYYYLAAAGENTRRDDVPQTNLLAFWARNPQLLSLDSLARATDHRDYDSFEANRMALNVLRSLQTDSLNVARPGWLDEPLPDAGLNVGRFASVYNYALLNRSRDTTLLGRLQRLELNPANQDFTEDLMFARAVSEYYTNNRRTALELTDQLARDNARRGAFFNSVTGLWLLEQGLYRKAAEVLGQNSDTLSVYYRAIAYTKAGDVVSAQSLWEQAAASDAGVRALTEVLYGSRPPSNDTERAFLLLYGNPGADQAASLLSTVQNADIRTVTAAHLSRRALIAGKMAEGERWFEQIPDFANLKPYTGSLLTVTYMRLQNARRQFGKTLEAGRQTVVPALTAEKAYLLAEAHQAKRQISQARQFYAQALQQAPFSAETVLAAARLEQRLKQTEKAYNLTLNALPLNDNDPGLLKTYIDLCLDMRLTDYAQDALPRLQAAVPPADYQAYLTHYQARRALLQKEQESFQ